MLHRQVYQKFIFHLSLFGVSVSILVGFYEDIFHSLLEFIHTILEVIEISLDKLIEHTFETELRETQIIVFYIMLLIGGGIIYCVWRLLVKVVSGAGHYFKIEWAEFKDAVIQDWQEMTMANRIICISVFVFVNYLASFFLF